MSLTYIIFHGTAFVCDQNQGYYLHNCTLAQLYLAQLDPRANPHPNPHPDAKPFSATLTLTLIINLTLMLTLTLTCVCLYNSWTFFSEA